MFWKKVALPLLFSKWLYQDACFKRFCWHYHFFKESKSFFVRGHSVIFCIVILWDIQVFVFLTIPWFTKSLTHQTWLIDRYKQGQYFSENFWTIWRTGAKFQALFNIAICSSYSITNYVKFSVFFLIGLIREN